MTDFYNSPAWRKLARAHKQLARKAGKYVCSNWFCWKKVNLESDHILPRSKFPDIALDINNLQLLCKKHNNKKRAKILIRPSVIRVLFYKVIKRCLWLTLLVSAGHYWWLHPASAASFLNQFHHYLSVAGYNALRLGQWLSQALSWLH